MKKMNKSRIGLDKLAFYIPYSALFSYAFFGHIEAITMPLKILAICSISLLIVSLPKRIKELDPKKIIPVLGLLLLSAIYILTAGNFILMKITILLLAANSISFDQRISFDLKLRTSLILLMLCMCALGVIQNEIINFTDSSGTIKYNLGFSNANTLGMHSLILCMDIIYLLRKKSTGATVAICSFIMILMYTFTKSRAAFYSTLICLFLIVLNRIKPAIFKNKIIKKIIILSPIIFSLGVIAIYIVAKNNPSLGYQLDYLTSGRITNIRIFVSNFPVTLFGSDITTIGATCDVSTIFALYAFGAIGLALFLCAFVKLQKHLYRQKEITLALIILAFLIYGLSEKLWLYADYNIFMTAFTFLLTGTRVKELRNATNQ